MKRSELDIAINWAAKEGWNPGLYDAEAFWETDPEGYFVGFLGDEPVSSISAVAYDEDFGFMGFYIVKEKYRGRDYGIKIFDHALRYMGDRNIGGDGVLEMLNKYKKKGFKLAYKNIRYKYLTKGDKEISKSVKRVTDIPFEDISKYDESIFPASRHKFLKPWVSQPESFSFGVTEGSEVTGYGVLRKCHKGYKIGPLFADSKSIAKNLFDSLISQVPKGTEVFFDTPEVNKEAVEIAKFYEMEKVFETGRIYTKKEPDVPMNKVFGVTTFELG